MIRNESVERSLHQWEPWVKAVEEARTVLKNSDAEACWGYAGAVMKTLRLPTKSILRTYFLSCVFSFYKHGEYLVFSEIRFPPSEKLKMHWLPHGVEVNHWHPLPPAIFTKKDVHRLLYEHRYYGTVLSMSLSAAIREIFAPYFVLLNREHPLCQIGSKMKGWVNPDIAIECAKMAEKGTKYAEINEKFGWKPQKGAYWNTNRGTHSKRNRFPTVRRYVRLGRKLINDSSEKQNRSFPEFLPDSPEQIARSINMTGLRTEIDQAFAAAIARARGRPRRSC